jgi:hypothetical protein
VIHLNPQLAQKLNSKWIQPELVFPVDGLPLPGPSQDSSFLNYSFGFETRSTKPPRGSEASEQLFQDVPEHVMRELDDEEVEVKLVGIGGRNARKNARKGGNLKQKSEKNFEAGVNGKQDTPKHEGIVNTGVVQDFVLNFLRKKRDLAKQGVEEVGGMDGEWSMNVHIHMHIRNNNNKKYPS